MPFAWWIPERSFSTASWFDKVDLEWAALLPFGPSGQRRIAIGICPSIHLSVGLHLLVSMITPEQLKPHSPNLHQIYVSWRGQEPYSLLVTWTFIFKVMTWLRCYVPCFSVSDCSNKNKQWGNAHFINFRQTSFNMHIYPGGATQWSCVFSTIHENKVKGGL